MFTNRFVHYAIDFINSERVSGWAFLKIKKRHPLALKFYLDKDYLGEISADESRQDLKDQSLHPDGQCGFTFTFPTGTDFSGSKYLHIYGSDGKPFCSVAAETIPQIFSDNLPKILFMHIPKTAGTSFNSYVRQRYPDGSTAIHIESLPAGTYGDLVKEKSYLAGHFRVETLRNQFDLPSFSLYTILRQPHRHLHSSFNWLRGAAASPKGSSFLNHPDYMQNLGNKLNNPNTDMKTTLKSLVSDLDGMEVELYDNRQTRHFLDYRPARVTEKDLERALENFSLFTDIGVTERYDAFLERFCKRYQLPFFKQEMPLNRSKYRKLYDVDDLEMQEILHPLVDYDLRLYEAALSLHYKR